MFLSFLFIILFTLNGYLSIHVHITCIVHDFGALRVAQKIQVMSSFQSDELSIVGSWFR